MIEAVYTTMRVGRNLLQWGLEPLDWVVRALNNKKNYPPLRLRQAVGNLNDFEGSVGEYVAYLKLLCNLQPGDSLVDVGCGCGTILTRTTESALIDYVDSYAGFDTDEKAIHWCDRHIKKFFHHLPRGTSLPGTEETVDVVLCKSLFTHLAYVEVETYLRRIYDLLKPGGKCLATFFILDGRKLEGRYTFDYKHEHGACERLSKPELAVAFNLKYLQSLFKRLKFSYQVWYGTWRGTREGLSFQDIVILKKE